MEGISRMRSSDESQQQRQSTGDIELELQQEIEKARGERYEEGMFDAAQDLYDKGYAEAIDDLYSHVWKQAYNEGYHAA
jgi:flagellar biosynthesis/type III secretory pathway protein FliH